jgi:hypothetical protein
LTGDRRLGLLAWADFQGVSSDRGTEAWELTGAVGPEHYGFFLTGDRRLGLLAWAADFAVLAQTEG